MALKFLVDVGVGRAVEERLRAIGYDTKAVRDTDPSAKDRDILNMAVDEGRMVITMDKDFGELVHNSELRHCGVLLLRVEDATGSEKAAVVEEILTKYGNDVVGKFCVYQDGRLRVRP